VVSESRKGVVDVKREECWKGSNSGGISRNYLFSFPLLKCRVSRLNLLGVVP